VRHGQRHRRCGQRHGAPATSEELFERARRDGDSCGQTPRAGPGPDVPKPHRDQPSSRACAAAGTMSARSERQEQALPVSPTATIGEDGLAGLSQAAIGCGSSIARTGRSSRVFNGVSGRRKAPLARRCRTAYGGDRLVVVEDEIVVERRNRVDADPLAVEEPNRPNVRAENPTRRQPRGRSRSRSPGLSSSMIYVGDDGVAYQVEATR